MEYSVIILLLPLCMFLFLGLVGHKLSERVAGILGTIGLSVAAVLAYVVAFNYFTMPRNAEGVFDTLQPINFEWLRFTEHLHIDLGILLDPISVMMLVVITTVSLMVHIYSMGYMHGEKGFQRYYAFLSLFSFSMLGLVVATNIFQMYIFWELVGVSSYLLIGFYYTKPAAVSASKKAFIVTRFADLGFLIGILILSFFTETFDFATLMSNPSALVSETAGMTFMGCSVAAWAMALIFMGGAGKSAMFPLHIWLPDAMEGPTPVSALIHAVHSNEMSEMGNLRKYMPVTHITFLIACLAIAGIPPFSGFFSKDEILTAAFEKSAFWGVWMTAVAGLTAFYMFRLYYRIFWWSKPSYEHHTPHEAPAAMYLPLVFLALVTCVAGFIPFGEFVSVNGEAYHIHLDWSVATTSIIVAVAAIALATWMYLSENTKPKALADKFRALHTAAYHRFYMDELYMWVTHKVIFQRICRPIAWFDRHIVDGTMNMLATVTNGVSYGIRKLQSGYIQWYVWVFIMGALLIAVLAMCF